MYLLFNLLDSILERPDEKSLYIKSWYKVFGFVKMNVTGGARLPWEQSPWNTFILFKSYTYVESIITLTL